MNAVLKMNDALNFMAINDMQMSVYVKVYFYVLFYAV